MFVSLLDESVPSGRVVASETKLCPARRPTTITVNNLLPGESYTVTFSGVSRECAGSRIGQFRTFDIQDRSLRMIAVSMDKPESVTSGEHDTWETLAARVLRKNLPAVDIVSSV